MEEKSMTALISAFSRAYHATNKKVTIFNDTIAKDLLTPEEYQQISMMMSNGISFFNPSFKGSPKEALDFIVDHQLSPSPLGRAAYTEDLLKKLSDKTTLQYLIFAAGYDTFAYRQPSFAQSFQIFEIDHPETAADKKARLTKSNVTIPENVHYVSADFNDPNWCDALLHSPNYQKEQLSFCSLLGLSYYLEKDVLKNMLQAISTQIAQGSYLVLDYPDDATYTEKAGTQAQKQTALAQGANEKMLSGYSISEMADLLKACHFQVIEQLEPEEITKRFFTKYNEAYPTSPMSAFEHVNYVFAQKKKKRYLQI